MRSLNFPKYGPAPYMPRIPPSNSSSVTVVRELFFNSGLVNFLYVAVFHPSVDLNEMTSGALVTTSLSPVPSSEAMRLIFSA